MTQDARTKRKTKARLRPTAVTPAVEGNHTSGDAGRGKATKVHAIASTVERAEGATRRRVTLKDVAQQAGVSVGMASRVLGDYGSFSDTTRRKVLEAAERIAYRPNALARSLRLGRTKALGVVVSNIVSYHWTNLLRGIESEAASRGYQVILGTTADNPKAERAYLQVLRERNVDGIILSPSPENEDVLRRLAEERFPMVLIECSMEAVAAPRINLDDRAAARKATEYLLSLGHRRIGLVAGAQTLPSGRDRRQGYVDALEHAGTQADPQRIGFGEYRFDDAYLATRRLLGLPSDDRPTALLVCNELMTGAALQCIKDMGVRVPHDVSLVAFDDPAWTSFFTPALTTVRNPRDRVAKLALETLLACISEPQSEAAAPVEHVVSTELVVRESCLPFHHQAAG